MMTSAAIQQKHKAEYEPIKVDKPKIDQLDSKAFGKNDKRQYHFFRGRHDGCFDDRDWNFDKDNKMV